MNKGKTVKERCKCNISTSRKKDEEEENEVEQRSSERSVLWNLPRDIIFDIFSRLPAKSLMRCRCVCKSLRTLVSDPCFVHMHLTRSSQLNNNPSLILVASAANKKKETYRGHPVVRIENDLFLVEHVGDNNEAVMLEVPPYESSLDVVDSCNGLLCLSNICGSTVFVCNPFTRECTKLPPSSIASKGNCGSNFNKLGFGFHFTTNEFKVLRLHSILVDHATDSYRTEAEVYTLGSASWKWIGDVPFKPFWSFWPRHKVFVGGAFHWLACPIGSVDPQIASFDIRDEKFRVVSFPTQFGSNEKWSCIQVEMFGGCLSLVNHSSHQCVEIWVMKHYGVKESWTKQFVFSMPEIVRSMHLLCLLKNGEILIEYENAERKLVSYNPKCQRGRTIGVHGPPRWFKAFTHVGSLVSPRQRN